MFVFVLVCICDLSNFVIILKRKSELVALLLLPYRCLVTVNVHGVMGLSAVCDCGIS